MTTNEKIIAFKMRIDGYSYEDIGKTLGYTKQNVQDGLMRIVNHRAVKCKYSKLREYVNAHFENIKDFSDYCNVEYNTLLRLLRGDQKPSIELINKLLKATELTYEEVFMEE